ncbi:hypothetical protein D9613_007674 [Agrocybe pediades]|uniref:Peptidase S9 prolyl oligopeptidase catalytic domain-containing protein n=1 Tax=Agrocybe pediades TaxID=84607 RepID=A0A8H4QNK3_9AGAR|nr:hypothetical protein D9613_007674 [Agrocybe pediades]
MSETVVVDVHVIGGISIRVYRSTGQSAAPIGVLFLLHGRHGSANDVDSMAKSIHEHGTKKSRLDLFIVTLDHRNHGNRIVESVANNTWTEEKNNVKHALDMYSIQSRSSSTLPWFYFMQSYLFPMNERRIEAWGIAGISLGGHSTWIALAQDARITVGIPIIGCPDYEALMEYRANTSNIPFEPPYIPSGFSDAIKSSNPASGDYTSLKNTNPFLGKKILVLSGQDDKLVPWTASKGFVELLEVGEEGLKEVVVQKGVGHECTKEMVERTAGFVEAELLK